MSFELFTADIILAMRIKPSCLAAGPQTGCLSEQSMPSLPPLRLHPRVNDDAPCEGIKQRTLSGYAGVLNHVINQSPTHPSLLS